MFAYIKRILVDEGAFIGLARAALGGFAALTVEGEVLSGVLAPGTANIVGAAALFVSLAMRSNVAPHKQ